MMMTKKTRAKLQTILKRKMTKAMTLMKRTGVVKILIGTNTYLTYLRKKKPTNS